MRALSLGRGGALRASGVVLVGMMLVGCTPDAPPPEAGARANTVQQSAAPAGSEAGGHPSIVLLISIDTLRADHLGVYGHDRFTSPRIDAMASKGTVFDDASATAPWTLPSHASLLTGLYPRRHGVATMMAGLPRDLPTLAAMLGEAGFTTAAVVNNTWLARESYGLTRDFDEYTFVDSSENRRSPNTWVTDEAIRWLSEHGSGPLFVFAHYFDVHTDYASLPEYEKLFVTAYDGPFTGDAWQLQVANLEDDYIAFCTREFDPEKCRFGGPDGPRPVDDSLVKLVPGADDLRHLEELYDAGIRQLDTELGRLFGFLRDGGYADRTLLILTSDHGEEFGDHGRVEHFSTQYQEMLHVPLIMVGPGVPIGERVSAAVSLVDIVPTVLSMTGVPLRADLDGLDLSPLLRREGEQRFSARIQYGEASGGHNYAAIVAPGIFPIHRSIRRGRHKLVYESKRDEYALFDLDADPGEQRDISTREPVVTAELIALMKDRYHEYTPEPRPENRIELGAEDLEKLRALGYVP
ncbi:MAG: sulfatase [Deltaproteobacteria bacterium]|nr:sulfatase [Deltaproteobacteria bacterium]